MEVELSWIDPTDLPEAFLSQSLKRQGTEKIDKIYLPRGSQPETDQTSDLGLIFHTGRCGSSLVCQAVKEDAIVFGEPEVFGHLFSQPMGSWRQDELSGVSRHLLDFFARASNGAVIVKFSSWQVLFSSALIPPTVPVAFLFREPTAVISSMLAQPPSWATSWLGDGSGKAAVQRWRGLEPAAAAAALMVAFLDAGLQLHCQGHLTLEYERLRPSGIRRLRSHFHLADRGEDEQVWALDAKDPERKRAYTHVPSASSAIRDALSPVSTQAKEAYERLRLADGLLPLLPLRI